MSQIAPRVFKGARDFLPEQMLHRERITDVMRSVFKKYGFAPLETPAIEYLDVLTGKYGEDADRLIYRLDYKTGSKDAAALHYDLTVPFSRVVAMNPDLPLPFKRYQIQPVWRADRPQPHQGRFREFYQCDIDAVGSTSMLIDAEMVAITNEILTTLGFKTHLIKINNRKILNGITQYAGLPADMTQEVCRSIDKLDKMPWSEVEKELSEKQVAAEAIEKLERFTSEFKIENDFSGFQIFNNRHKNLLRVQKVFVDSNIEIGIEGCRELFNLFKYVDKLGVNPENVVFDLTLARGLDYYTGPIFETKLTDQPHMGSLTGGGRYDGLIGMLSGRDMPAVGTTLGLDRIFTAMQQLNMLEAVKTSTKVLIAQFSEDSLAHCIQLAKTLRENGIATEIYPDAAKMKKQFGYADKKGIPFIAILGETEIAEQVVSLKDLKTGTQIKATVAEVIEQVR